MIEDAMPVTMAVWAASCWQMIHETTCSRSSGVYPIRASKITQSAFMSYWLWKSNGANSCRLRRQVRNSWAVFGETYAVFLTPIASRAS